MLNSKKYGPPTPFLASPPDALFRPQCSAYLISIAVANKIKSKFYDTDLPALEDVSLVPMGDT